MKLYNVPVFLSIQLIPQLVGSAPLDNARDLQTSEIITERSVHAPRTVFGPEPAPLEQRDVGVYNCLDVSPDTNMPTVSDATWIANYLIGLNQNNCSLERPAGSSSPAYQNLFQYGTAQVNMYFTPDAGTGFRATFYCFSLGNTLQSLIDACKTGNSKIEGWTDEANCPNKGIVSTSPLSNTAPGVAIEVMPAGTR